MKNEQLVQTDDDVIIYEKLLVFPHSSVPVHIHERNNRQMADENNKPVPEILIITSYPPSECGIATYTHDLMVAIKNKFGKSFSIKICALEGIDSKYKYPSEVKYILQTSEQDAYERLAKKINQDRDIGLIFIQHEFGLYGGKYGAYILNLISLLNKPIITTFHTVLPKPDLNMKKIIQKIAVFSESIVVMTKGSANILEKEYEIHTKKITVIPHGTHLVTSLNNSENNPKKYLEHRLVLTTFGLLSSGKSIETALEALPAIIDKFPNVLYLILGKTHPGIVKIEGEKYRDFLYEKVLQLNLQNNVKFINQYLLLNDILEYLQRTDIYLFTSKDPNQAVSGTLAYAVACGCPVVATPIPHANELLGNDDENIFDFENSQQLADAVNRLLNNKTLRESISERGIHTTAATAWQNAAIAHARLFEKTINRPISLHYTIPPIDLSHVKKMTTDFGMIQFSRINKPDLGSGYTLDDNARALVAMCQHYESTNNMDDLAYIFTYLEFIKHCQQPEGDFLNYVDIDKNFTFQNNETNLADANGRAVWALGYLISKRDILPELLIAVADKIITLALPSINNTHSSRAISFAIKGLYYYNRINQSAGITFLIKVLANRLVQMYKHENTDEWHWFESYLTYGNSSLPEALLCAHLETGEGIYRDIAKTSFDFLLSVIFQDDQIKVVSNRGWHIKGKPSNQYGEQPIDVAYTIMALCQFYDTFKTPIYLDKMKTAFDWFLGKNHLHQIIYNPCTGGCYDGLEEDHINLNQGAESTISYLMARLMVDEYLNREVRLEITEKTQSNQPIYDVQQLEPKAMKVQWTSFIM